MQHHLVNVSVPHILGAIIAVGSPQDSPQPSSRPTRLARLSHEVIDDDDDQPGRESGRNPFYAAGRAMLANLSHGLN